MKPRAGAVSAAPDRYDLYEMAVTDGPRTARFLEAVHAGEPRLLREDFCGSGALARAWASLSPEHRAVCVDSEQEPITALRARLPQDLAGRVVVRCADVLDADDRADLIAGLNFPAGYFHDRPSLLDYLRRSRARLNAGGVMVLDVYAGAHAFALCDVERELPNGVVYTWEQREANPLNGRVLNAMHFRLPDGRVVRDAFLYDWRLWSAPELADAMLEAGFARVDMYDRLGDAVDDRRRVHVLPTTSPDDLDENYVLYIAGRV